MGLAELVPPILMIFKSIKWRLQLWYGLILVVVLAVLASRRTSWNAVGCLGGLMTSSIAGLRSWPARCAVHRRAGRKDMNPLSAVRPRDSFLTTARLGKIRVRRGNFIRRRKPRISLIAATRIIFIFLSNATVKNLHARPMYLRIRLSSLIPDAAFIRSTTWHRRFPGAPLDHPDRRKSLSAQKMIG